MPSIESNQQAGKAAIEAGTLVRATTPAVDVAPPTPPLTNTNQSNTFLRTPLPASYVQQPDQQRSWQAWGVTPQSRVPPLPPASNAQAGAQAASQATVVVEQTPPSTGTGGGITSVGLTVPSILTVTGSPVVPPSGTFVVGLAAEPSGTVFNVPPAGLSAIEALSVSSLATGGTGSTFTLTATPTTATSWGLFAFVGTVVADLVNPVGWTAFNPNPSTNGNAGSFTKALSGTSPVSVSETIGTNDAVCGLLAIFSGALPATVQQTNTQAFSAPSTVTTAFSSNNTAGNTILVIVSVSGAGPAAPVSVSVSDTLGNVYSVLANQQVSGGGSEGATLYVVIAPNCLGGANSIKTVVGNNPGSGGARLVQAIELGPLAAGPGTPLFSQLFPSQIPPINVGSSGNGGITGIGKVSHGFTGADLSATGGTNQFVSQASTGAAFTVVQPDFSNLAGAAGALATSYNGIALVSNGIPSEIKTVDLTAQTAAIGTTNILASVPATGQYRLCWNSKVTTPDGASSTLGPLTIVYTDADNTVQTITAGAQNKNGAIETSDATNLTTTVMLGIPMMLNARTGTAITYAMAYASGTPATMAYNLHLKLEAL